MRSPERPFQYGTKSLFALTALVGIGTVSTLDVRSYLEGKREARRQEIIKIITEGADVSLLEMDARQGTSHSPNLYAESSVRRHGSDLKHLGSSWEEMGITPDMLIADLLTYCRRCVRGLQDRDKIVWHDEREFDYQIQLVDESLAEANIIQAEAHGVNAKSYTRDDLGFDVQKIEKMRTRLRKIEADRQRMEEEEEFRSTLP